MREIKFRGLELMTGDWVYGSHLKTGTSLEYIVPQNLIANSFLPYTVDKDTVGQFTGLKDKNGKEIFEGDILGAEDEKPMYIEYSKGQAAFVFIDKFDSFGTTLYTTTDISYEGFEVIGNIYDNTELLETQE